MMRGRIWLVGLFLTGIMLGSMPVRSDAIICPGSGERCAQVKVLFIKYWKMKEKGGPGILILEGVS